MIGHDGFMEKMAKPLSPKKEIRSPQYRRFPRNLGVYTMENKDKNTNYLEIVGVGDQK